MERERTLLIVDLEATCWESAEHKTGQMETIEIGAAIVRLNYFDDVSFFQTFVRPVRHPVLSNFCKDLTLIRQSDVDGADIFPVSFKRFLDWVGDPLKVRFSSWGEYDRKQLLRDCYYHKVGYPFMDDHFNLKKYVARSIGCKPQGLGQILKRTGLGFEGTHHRALDDVKNICRILRFMTDGDQKGSLLGYKD